jgi:hypothetical protein
MGMETEKPFGGKRQDIMRALALSSHWGGFQVLNPKTEVQIQV